jgi:hypothetical protein
VRRWARQAAWVHGELGELAEVGSDPRWWLVAGGAALVASDTESSTYVASDADPQADTFIGHVAPRPAHPLAHGLARAHAARAAVRALDGTLPDQPLAVTIRRGPDGAAVQPSALDVVALAIGDQVILHQLAARIEDERFPSPPVAPAVPFATIAVGDEPLATARHGHRRAWHGDDERAGPWLGLGSAGELDLVSTCHLVVDGYGHARLAAEIAARTPGLAARIRPDLDADHTKLALGAAPPPLPPVSGGAPLTIAWRALPAPAPRALPLAYALGTLLHRLAGRPQARFSPTFQIPVAPGERGDPARLRRRVVPALASVRFEGGRAEPYEAFAARVRTMLAREAHGDGVISQLLAAARAVPAPLAWKRRAVGPARPGWLGALADVLGGRGCVSRIQLDAPSPPACAVSSPARLATARDPFGGSVLTVIDDGSRAAITLCGSGTAAAPELLDELLAELPG